MRGSRRGRRSRWTPAAGLEVVPGEKSSGEAKIGSACHPSCAEPRTDHRIGVVGGVRSMNAIAIDAKRGSWAVPPLVPSAGIPMTHAM